MNTLTKGFARRVISMLLATIMVFSLGIVGLTTASAANVELSETGWGYVNCVFYFDNSVSKWSGVQLLVGRDYDYWEGNYKHDKGSQGYKMTNIPNTDLWYVQISDFKFVSDICFTSVGDNWSWSGSGISDQINYLKTTSYKYSQAYKINQDFSNNRFFKANSASSPTSLSYTYYGSTDDMNKIAQKAIVRDISSGTSTTSKSVGTVQVSGIFVTGIGQGNTATVKSTLNSTSEASVSVVRSSKVTLTATPATGYNFVGWTTSASDTTSSSKSKTITYNSTESNTTYYALFEKAVSISSPTATINTNSIVIGDSAEITFDYNVTGSSSTPVIALCDKQGNAYTANYVLNGNVFTVTPPVPGTYYYQVKVTVDGVYAFTDVIELQCNDKFSASIGVDSTAKYVEDDFTFTIKDNAETYGGATYEVFCNDSKVDANVTDKTFTVSHDKAGEYVYYVVATVAGQEPVYTNKITITVKDKVFSVYVEAPKSNMEDRAFQIKATTEFAAGDVTYTLTGPEGINLTNNSGIFSVTVNTVGEYTFTVKASDGVNADVVKTVKITITEDKGTYPVKIYFKCSDTFGYLPNAKVNGTAVNLTKESAIICYNASDSATYSWYSYTSDGNLDYGTKVTFAVNANRNYFYNASLTISAGEGDFVQEGDYYCYYLALENLNGGTNTLSNISALNADERNWTESAVNMIYDKADADKAVALNYAFAAMADANVDGDINVKDATYIQKSLANMVEASELSELVSDVNGDGKVTIKDATAIQKQIAGL